MNPVVHFEAPYADGERLAKFYKDAFGWQITMMGEDMGNYILATTTETGDSGPKKPGVINGGFFPKDGAPMTGPSFVIQVENIAGATQRVKDSGGKVLGEPVDIPGVGLYILFVDTEGNKLSMLQPAQR
ncbi:VOC family protein [Pelagibacterium halotolerans]|uniref:VOC family protein n=1 Tax=Pelagibacterium halotolerans TaxID=531813 RepID=UPI00384C3DD6